VSPYSLLWHGRDLVQAWLDTLDPATRATAEADLQKLSASPTDPDLPWWDWQGQDYLDFWKSRVALVADRFHIRYITWDPQSAETYTVVTITDRETGTLLGGAPLT
jgi:hypothetical protein